MNKQKKPVYSENKEVKESYLIKDKKYTRSDNIETKRKGLSII